MKVRFIVSKTISAYIVFSIMSYLERVNTCPVSNVGKPWWKQEDRCQMFTIFSKFSRFMLEKLPLFVHFAPTFEKLPLSSPTWVRAVGGGGAVSSYAFQHTNRGQGEGGGAVSSNTFQDTNSLPNFHNETTDILRCLEVVLFAFIEGRPMHWRYQVLQRDIYSQVASF